MPAGQFKQKKQKTCFGRLSQCTMRCTFLGASGPYCSVSFCQTATWLFFHCWGHLGHAATCIAGPVGHVCSILCIGPVGCMLSGSHLAHVFAFWANGPCFLSANGLLACTLACESVFICWASGPCFELANGCFPSLGATCHMLAVGFWARVPSC
jgi:hypothetical protein